VRDFRLLLALSQHSIAPKPAKTSQNGQFSEKYLRKPEKTVEIRRFSIDFARPKAALLRTTGFAEPA
jgi:hypothetical protein